MTNNYNRSNIESEYRKYLITQFNSRSTFHNYFSDVKRFLDWYELQLLSNNLKFSLLQLNRQSLSNYHSYLQQLHTAPKTIKRFQSSLTNFLNFLFSQGYISHNPTKYALFSPLPFLYKANLFIRTYYLYLGLFLLGFIPIVIFFLYPTINQKGTSSINQTDSAKSLFNFYANAVASTSADLFTIPIVDENGTINLTAPYPAIKGYVGTLTISAPQLALESELEGSIRINSHSGSTAFIFEGTNPPLPYYAGVSITANNMTNGSLLYGTTKISDPSVNFMDFTSGNPAQTKFRVDSEGNVYIKGNIILEGNLISSPNSVIFGSVEPKSATSSSSPEL